MKPVTFKTAAFIPARLQSQRFPGKLLRDLGGKPVVVRTWENAVKTGLFDTVWVITDSPEIAEAVRQAGGEVKISRRAHASGTDRIAEYAGETEADIIINIQADEPFVSRPALGQILEAFATDTKREIDIVSLMQPIENEKDFYDPNRVKVVTDLNGYAMYFSRAPIPYPRDGKWHGAFGHIGIYAFRRDVLEQIARLPETELEKIEKLENLRFLQAGFRIKMLLTGETFMGIDTPEDLEKARKMLGHE